MHLALLAFPLTVVLVGVICYKSFARPRRDQEFNEAVTEGYYVYHSPLYWTAPGVSGAHGAPPNHAAFPTHPAPYQPYSQTPNASMTRTTKPEELIKPPNSESTINFPQKTADPSASFGSSKIDSEKTLIRDDSVLLLSETTLEKKPSSPVKDSQNSSFIQNSHPVTLNPFMTKLDVGNGLQKPPLNPTNPNFKTSEFSPPNVFPETGYDIPSGSNPEQCQDPGMRKEFHENYMVSDQYPDGPTVNQTDPAQDMINSQNSIENEDALPRYTSGDRRIFEKFHQRVSLKQDHSYIGRMKQDYRPPSTVSPLKKKTPDNSVPQKPSSISKFESKKI